jgi:hypothetical protein
MYGRDSRIDREPSRDAVRAPGDRRDEERDAARAPGDRRDEERERERDRGLDRGRSRERPYERRPLSPDDRRFRRRESPPRTTAMSWARDQIDPAKIAARMARFQTAYVP